MLEGRSGGPNGHDYMGGLLFQKGKGPLGSRAVLTETTDRLPSQNYGFGIGIFLINSGNIYLIRNHMS